MKAESSNICSKNISHELFVQHPSTRANQEASSEAFNEPLQALKETMSVSDRKRYLIYPPDDSMREKMETHVHRLYNSLDKSRNEHDCWLHPAPPPAYKNGRPMGAIKCRFFWEDSSGKHRLVVNFGVLALLVKHHLTKKQVDGYVNQSWHLSHLCGNWTCCNWRHLTVESGSTNTNRNQCFRKVTRCPHDPPCMRDRKRHFSVTPAISSQIKRAIDTTQFDSISTTPATQYITFSSAYPGFGCGICGPDIDCLGDRKICRSLASATKCQEALGELESCLVPNLEVLRAMTNLKQIIKDLLREKKASDSMS